MSILDRKRLLQTSFLTSLMVMGSAGMAFAQTAPETDEVEEIDLIEEEADGAEEDELIVTGSRIKRDSFSSLAPLQVIDFDEKRDLGIIDPVTILQTTESAAGQQIDSTFGGFVLDNGPGSETINIRGLGANRTLVLVNGRRIAPAGVEGAPSQPSINIIPSSLVDRTDLLLEGASSVYGSDAVAGVVNVLLRKDFEGFDVVATYNPAEDAGGQDYNIAGSWGMNTDRGFIGVGAEYDFRDALKLVDRDYLGGCDEHYEIDENGQIRTQNADQIVFDEWYGGTIQAADQGSCKTTGISGRLFERSSRNTFGSIYYLPGQSNIGIPNYIDQNFQSVPIDADGDGVQDFGFEEFSTNGADPNEDIIPEQKRYNLMAYGEYTLDGDSNITPFFEVIYSRTESEINNDLALLGAEVGVDNPFNPCGNFGVDCGSNNFVFDQAFSDRWNTYYRDRDPNRDGDTRDARICSTFGAALDADGNPVLGTAPFDNALCTPSLFGRGQGSGDFSGPVQVRPIVSIQGDRQSAEVVIENTRLVGGVRGDMPFLNTGSLSDWSFEISGTYSESNGTSVREGILADRLYYALGNDVNTGNPIAGLAPCTTPDGVTLSPDLTTGCVPVNLFAPSVYSSEQSNGAVVGDFATQAERDYVFGLRTFDTKYQQTIINGFMSGTLFEAPAGDVNAVFGVEYREDEITSIPNDVARDGLLIGFFSDAGAVGSRWTKEAFAEVDIPLVADQPLFENLEMNVSGRVTEDEFYGLAGTYSFKAGWRPFESLLLKASYGTSFRSPNIRENFLRPQTGFLTLFDPCVVPSEAFQENPLDPTAPAAYDPSADTREPDTLARCRAEGLDPTTLGGGGSAFFSTEIERAGSLDLDPETSTSFTTGFSFEQPFTDAFGLTLGMSYYDIDVKDSVITPSSQFIINDCYVNVRDGRSPFCDRIRRDENQQLDSINAAFLNLDENRVRGLDLNAEFDKEFTIFERNIEYGASLRANHIIEASTLFVNNDGSLSEDEDAGEFGFSDWAGTLTHRLTYNDFSLLFSTRYVSSVEQDVDGIDEFSNAFGIDTDDNGEADLFSDTCGGPAVGDVNCRDVGFADDYYVHNIGLSYNNEDKDWGLTLSVSNLFAENPPKADSSEVLTRGNAVIGNGYDLEGRKFFVQLRKGF